MSVVVDFTQPPACDPGALPMPDSTFTLDPVVEGLPAGRTSDLQIHEPDETGWARPPTGGANPVDDAVYLRNVEINAQRQLPDLRWMRPHDGVLLFCAAGPSLAYMLDDYPLIENGALVPGPDGQPLIQPGIRARMQDPRVKLMTSNATHDYLIDNGIVPWGQLIIDPKPKMADYCTRPHKDVIYFIAPSCDPLVFERLAGFNVVRVWSIGGLPGEQELADRLAPQDAARLGGGTMAPLRSMVLGHVLGFAKEEFYGFDSCLALRLDETGKAVADKSYAYDKQRPDGDIPCEVLCDDGRVFLSTLVFSSQARQFLKWKRRLGGLIEFTVHGDGLTAHANRLDEARLAEMRKRFLPTVITDGHREKQARIHRDDATYGADGAKWARAVELLALQLETKFGPVTLLDYGCGKQGLAEALPHRDVLNYDPAVKGYDVKPEPCDIVVCTNVLEHVEPDCLDAVLDDLARVARKVLLVAIAIRETEDPVVLDPIFASQAMPMLHKPAVWWLPQLRSRFIVREHKESGAELTLVLVAKAAVPQASPAQSPVMAVKKRGVRKAGKRAPKETKTVKPKRAPAKRKAKS